MSTAESNFDLIVFDWDGTLYDSAATIAHCIQQACADLELPVPSDEEARYVIGLGLEEALRHAAPTLAEKDYPRIIERYRVNFVTRNPVLKLFDGVDTLISALSERGRMLAVATGKSRQGLAQALTATGLAHHFLATRCAEESFSKPHPAMLEEIMSELGCAPERTLMVGDTTHDLQMASNAGVPSLAVSFGAHPRHLLEAESPLACLRTPAQMAEWLLTHG